MYNENVCLLSLDMENSVWLNRAIIFFDPTWKFPTMVRPKAAKRPRARLTLFNRVKSFSLANAFICKYRTYVTNITYKIKVFFYCKWITKKAFQMLYLHKIAPMSKNWPNRHEAGGIVPVSLFNHVNNASRNHIFTNI